MSINSLLKWLNTNPTVDKVASYVLLLAGLAFLSVSVYVYFENKNFLKNALSSKADIIDFKVTRRVHESPVYFPIISFTHQNGQKVQFTSQSGWGKGTYNVGQIVEVLYLEKPPHEARINSFSSIWFSFLILLGFGTIFTPAGVYKISRHY